MNYLYRLLGVVLLLAGAPAHAADHWKSLLGMAPEGSQVGLVVEPLDPAGAVHIDYQPDLLLPPASTLKLFTAYAAEQALGDDYHYRTSLSRRGSRHGNRWQGDWRLTFSGAPDFSRDQLGQLLDRIHDSGVRTIDGNLLLDTGTFDGYAWGKGWSWDNLGVCYSAPVPALILDRNCVAASLTPTTPGSRAHFYIPPQQPLDVSSDARTVTAAQQRDSLCELQLDTAPGNHYRLHGCVANTRKIWPLNFAVVDPVAFATAILKKQLAERHIRLNGHIRQVDDAGSGWQNVAQVNSAPLSDLLAEMLQDSDNLYADSLLKTLGHRRSGVPGNFRNGARALKEVLEPAIGTSLEPAVMADGSGLSRNNLVQPAQLARLLRTLARHPDSVSYRALAVAGESGTLHYRHSLRKPPLVDNVRGKTGTLQGTSNLAGYLTAASGRHYLFVLMVSGISLDDDTVEKIRRTPMAHPVRAMEKAVLEWVYRHG